MLREAVESKMKEDMNSHIPQERVQLFLDTLAKSLKILLQVHVMKRNQTVKKMWIQKQRE